MKVKLREVPLEASIFYIGWIWLGWSMFGMTLVNMLMSGFISNLYHLLVLVIYLLPMLVVGYRSIKQKNIHGVPLIIYSGMVGILAYLMHLKMNLGLTYIQYSGEITEVVVIFLLLVGMPVSFYLFAISSGCENRTKLKILPIFAMLTLFVIFINWMLNLFSHSMVNASLIFYFLFVIGPVLGGVYTWEMISKDKLCV